MINFIVDGLSLDFNRTIVHVSPMLDSLNEIISLAKAKFIFKKFEQLLNINLVDSFNLHWRTTEVPRMPNIQSLKIGKIETSLSDNFKLYYADVTDGGE